MHGTITAREVLLHGVTIVRLWGPRCWLRCVGAALSGRPCTFLAVLDPLHR